MRRLSPRLDRNFASQAVIRIGLHHAFPNDPIVGEDNASDLRTDSGANAQGAYSHSCELNWNRDGTDISGCQDSATKCIDTYLLDAIDPENHLGGQTGRMWTIDPFYGTKGFLRGKQYAVCLALIVDVQVKVGCPNVPLNFANPEKRGCIFVAVKVRGAEQLQSSATRTYCQGIKTPIL